MWNEASYSLPILFGTEQSLNHLKSLKEISRLKFQHNLPIQNLYGSPSDAVWNGGRNLENAEIWRFFEGDIERYFRYASELLDTNLFLTFSNHLAGDYLNDEVSNLVLNNLIALKDKNNGVIISDDRLLDYIKGITDNITTKASILKSTVENPLRRSVEYYNELLARYDILCLHPDDNQNLELISKLDDVSRVEILVDERCTADCRVRDKHYTYLNESNVPHMKGEAMEKESNLLKKQCLKNRYVNDPVKNFKSTLAVLKHGEIEQLYNIGIRKFKTSGRGDYIMETMAINKFLDMAVADEDERIELTYSGFGMG
jgi:collagenase-like PrtC family protease